MKKKCGLCGCTRAILITAKVRVQAQNGDFQEGSYKPLCLRCFLKSIGVSKEVFDLVEEDYKRCV